MIRSSSLLGDDRDARRIEGTGELGRVAAVGDARDLRRGEGDDLDVGIVSVDDVEVMEVAPRGAHDDDSPAVHRGLLSACRATPRRGVAAVHSGRRPPGSECPSACWYVPSGVGDAVVSRKSNGRMRSGANRTCETGSTRPMLEQVGGPQEAPLSLVNAPGERRPSRIRIRRRRPAGPPARRTRLDAERQGTAGLPDGLWCPSVSGRVREPATPAIGCRLASSLSES